MMQCIMTPLKVKMLLHYYAIAEPYSMCDENHANSIAVKCQRLELTLDGLLVADLSNPSGFSLTDKGQCYVEAICNVPLPVMKWKIPK